MTKLCYFCKRERAESECEVCRRLVCMQCAGSSNHNCYPREWINAATFSVYVG